MFPVPIMVFLFLMVIVMFALVFEESHFTNDYEGINLSGVERGELRKDINADVAIDALYSPLFYRLLLKHQPLTKEFVDELIDAVIGGLEN